LVKKSRYIRRESQLTINGEKTYKSAFGGFISLIDYLVLLPFAEYKLTLFFRRDVYAVATNVYVKQISDDGTLRELNSYDVLLVE